MLDEPLSEPDARKLIITILDSGVVIYSRHVREEMDKDGLNEADIEQALRGTVEPAEWENGSWRYRIHSYEVVVVAFRSERALVVVTAWRRTR